MTGATPPDGEPLIPSGASGPPDVPPGASADSPGPSRGPAPWHGGAVDPAAECVLATNPGPLTLDGTNTWVLGYPGSGQIVVDPGPEDEGHLRSVLEAVYRRGAGVAVVLLTHGHPDHAAGARRFARLAAAPVRALNPAHRLGAQGLTEGDEVTVDGFTLRVLTTPGHSSDSVCFVLPAIRALITGDTVLGRGTSLVAYPDGSLVDYLRTLHRLAGVVRDSRVGLVLPGHGPVLTDPGRVLADHLAHRRDRLEQVRAARAAGATTARAVVERVYADVAPALWPAAELSVRAQLDYLETAPEEDHPPRG